MAYVGNLYTYLGVTLVYFHNDRGGYFIRKITDPMAIMIRDVELMVECFWFLWEFKGFLYFFSCPPKILGGIMWRPQKEPPISNSKIVHLIIVDYFAQEIVGSLFFC
jgi:hypothetical protein